MREPLACAVALVADVAGTGAHATPLVRPGRTEAGLGWHEHPAASCGRREADRLVASVMVRVRWEDLERTPLYEDVVSVLLSRLHPNAERIDGIGGDGGRDVQLRTPERLNLFELKSFTGRLSAKNPNRRSQVEESLRNAAGLQPDSWALVVPIDHNKQELKWFDGLRKQYPFPLVWHGRTWLDDQIAAFPDVHRYYIEGVHNEVVELLRQLNAEQSALAGGVVDAIARLDVLRTRLNELDPQYRFELTPGTADIAMAAFPNAAMYTQRSSEHGPLTIAVIPRYRDALRDRPILVNADLAFPDTEIGQGAADRFRAFLDYGDPAVVVPENVQQITIDAPGGLGGALGPGTLRVGPGPEGTPFLLDGRLRVFDEAGRHLASLPIRFTSRHSGLRGGTIAGHDATGILHVAIRVDEAARRVKVDLEVRQVDGQLPASLLAPLRLAHALRRPHRAAVAIGGGDLWEEPKPLPDLDLVPGEYLELVEQLARIQAETNTPFPLPRDIDTEDVATLHRLARLFDGEPLALRPEPVEFTLKSGAPLPWRTNNDQGYFGLENDFTETMMGEEIPLGRCNAVIGPAAFNEEAKPDPALPPGDVRVRLVPCSDARAFLRRGPLAPPT